MEELRADLVSCRRCPRLAGFRESVPVRAAFRGQDYWRKPVPGFGDLGAGIVVVGLAPAAHGGNRTGRVFTGDASAAFLMKCMHAAGLASKPESLSKDDGLVLKGCYITAAVKCVPPGDRPTREEFQNCAPYLDSELSLLPRVQSIVALGHLAFESITKWAERKGADVKRMEFRHGGSYALANVPTVYACYHPSPRNTNTGKLTAKMMTSLFRKVVEESNRREVRPLQAQSRAARWRKAAKGRTSSGWSGQGRLRPHL